ncbi:hypothetical protein D3C73_1660380 [compost metagenome]
MVIQLFSLPIRHTVHVNRQVELLFVGQIGVQVLFYLQHAVVGILIFRLDLL